MPTSAKKSSLPNRRNSHAKAHVPFRGDNPEVGKKTGVAVAHVDQGSDGFEPFDAVMNQADNVAPPPKRGRPRKRPLSPQPFADDEEGEVSMEIDDETALNYFTNTRTPDKPSSLNRLASSSRATRSATTAFDKVPSPRNTRNSLNGRKNASHVPSSLSQSIRVASEDGESDPEAENDDNYSAGGTGTVGGVNDDQNGFSPSEPDLPEDSPQQQSFLEMDQDEEEDEVGQEEDDEEEEEPTPPPKPSSKRSDKGKGKTKEPTPEDEPLQQEEEEEELVYPPETDDMDMVGNDDHEERQEDSPPPKKRAKVQAEEKPRKQQQKKAKKRSLTPEDTAGLRRGKRTRYGPLQWWRQEKVVYGRRDSGITFVPQIKEIRRVPQEPVVPLGAKNKRKRGTHNPTRVKKERHQDDVEQMGVINPEEGWDDDTPQMGTVQDFITKEEVQRRIAFTARMVEPRPAANNDWFFQKVFGDGDFIAAGQLIIPPKGRKPSKGTKDNTYVFYVIEGAINLKVHDTSLILATGGMFMVPRGNTYFIENIADRDAKLFFTQARKIAAGEDEVLPNVIPASQASNGASSAPPTPPPPARIANAGAATKASRVNGRPPPARPRASSVGTSSPVRGGTVSKVARAASTKL